MATASCDNVLASAHLLDDKLVRLLNERMTDDEQRLFCESFRAYLAFDVNKDFVVNLDDVYAWIGFSRKDNAKRSVLRTLKPVVDYNVEGVFLPSEENPLGGRPAERTMMTVNAFKQLCMAAGTERGKKVREYYLAMESVLHEYSKQAIKEARQEAQRAQIKCNVAERLLESERQRHGRCFGPDHQGEHTYIYKDSSDPTCTVYNVGRSAHLGQREEHYKTCNFGGRFVQSIPCIRASIVEKSAHHMLDEFRIMRRSEWFETPLPIIRDIVETTQIFHDAFVGRCEYMHKTGITDLIRKTLLNAMDNCDRTQSTSEVGKTSEPSVQAKESEAPPKPVAAPAAESARDPLDFPRFVEERCVTATSSPESENMWSFSADLIGCYRLWARTTQKGNLGALRDYLKVTFRAVKRLDEATGSQLIAYEGLRVRQPPTLKPGTDVARFVSEQCRVGYVHRTSARSLFEAFGAWRRANGLQKSAAMTASEKRAMEDELSTVFLYGQAFTGRASEYGFFGLALKDSSGLHVGLKRTEKLQKRVIAINTGTRMVEHVFPSLTATAAFFGVKTVSSVCQDVRFRRVRSGYFLMYSEDAGIVVGSRVESGDWNLATGARETARPILPVGISYATSEANSKFRAHIGHKGKQNCLGVYATLAEATVAREVAERAIERERAGGPPPDFAAVRHSLRRRA